jgi:hypothetical protein
VFKSGKPVDELWMFLYDKNPLTDWDGALCDFRFSYFLWQSACTPILVVSGGHCSDQPPAFVGDLEAAASA